MHAATIDAVDDCDIFIAAAAVADYRPAQVAPKPTTSPAMRARSSRPRSST
jgi:phosphopantothenoylcysteine synthetase/decarboxylase